MQEYEFRQLMERLDPWFRPVKIGNYDGKWILHGKLRDGVTRAELENQIKNEPFEFDIITIDDELEIMVNESNRVILRLPKIPRLNILLFFATVLTTLLAGSMMEGGLPWERFSDLWLGIPFSVTLLLILGSHEFGHYYFARKHRVDATLPYFIPAPTFIGTFGAVIRIKSPIRHRAALLQIGAAGPIAGFLVALPALIIGLAKSAVVDMGEMTAGFILGDSILMKFLVILTHPHLPDNQDIMLHPIAFAGWIGMLVTMLNLLPVGQLDGGHIAYAVFGDKHNKYAWWIFLALIPLSVFSLNWLFWAILILVFMRTAKHPPIMDIATPLSQKDQLIGIATLVIFILCFIPAPLKGI